MSRLTAAAGNPGKCSLFLAPPAPLAPAGERDADYNSQDASRLAFLAGAAGLRGGRPLGSEAGGLTEVGSRALRTRGYGSDKSQRLRL